MNPTLSSSSPIATPRPLRKLTVADFTTYEHRYHLTHRFPTLQDATCPGEGCTVAEGYIDECQPWRDLQLIGSDLTVHQTYETYAREDAPPHASIIVLLEGCAELRLGDQRRTLTAGGGLLLVYDRPQLLSARHIAGQHVRAVNLTILRSALDTGTRLTSTLFPLFQHTQEGLWPLAVSSGLRQSLAEWISARNIGPAASLLAEGLALQLLAQGLSTQPAGKQHTSTHRLCARDKRLLERVRECLAAHPGDPHTLGALAHLACMSPSTLREKFRLAYGQSIFDHLREQRLALAYRQLRDGASVQQVAAQVGYRHATNFATAFRQRYGMAPSDVH